MVRFLICAGLYTGKSGGGRVLYKLAEIIQQLGYSVFIVSLNGETQESDYMKSKNLAFFRDEITPEDIVIYPEIVKDNFLNAKNVVRYLLNRPMYVDGQPINYGDDDLLIGYHKFIDPHLDDLFILLDDRDLFYPPDEWDEKENIACIYLSKGRTRVIDQELSKFLDQFDQVVQITRSFPATKEDYAELLRNSKLLISFDPLTAVIDESLLCGTPVYLVDDFFKLSKLDIGMQHFGTFNYLALYENAIEEIPLFQLEFEMTVQGNGERVKNFITLATNYFYNIDKTKQVFPEIYRQLIYHKYSRKELDNYRYIKYIANNNGIYI